jgi:hypothetical protein
MTGWRKLADELRQSEESGDNRDDRANSSATAPIRSDPLSAFRSWRAALAAVDFDHPLPGLDATRSRQLLRDARWLLNHFAQRAAVDGWSAGELFGRWPGKDGWGGIADRLQGSRSLVMTDDRARWRTMFGGVAEQFNRTAYSDLRPLWEASDG